MAIPPAYMPRADDDIAPGDGTYPYDGGPTAPVPMPRPGAKSTPVPRDTLSGSDRLISVTPAKKVEKKGTKWAYPAYGEQAHRVKSGR
jgi:hypothetical protein